MTKREGEGGKLTLKFDDLALFGYLDQFRTEFDAELWDTCSDTKNARDGAIRAHVHARWGPDWS